MTNNNEHTMYEVDPVQMQILNDRLDQQEKTMPDYVAKFRALKQILLSVDGINVVPPRHVEVLIDLLLDAGVLCEGEVQLRQMAISRCHSNIVKLWRKGKVAAITSGYAMDGDGGIWREHTWGLTDTGEIIETTNIAKRYFGVRLSEREAQTFVEIVS